MKTSRLIPLTFVLAAALPLTAHAHKAWLLPSATVVSGDTPWVSVDGANCAAPSSVS